ncbi:MAG: MMPL family transporter [Kofleriaceae bacterium]|nr:MMPL family transporter [Kofleriaceae bacterium]
MLAALGGFVCRHARGVLVATAVFLAAAVGVVLRGGRLTAGEIDGLEAGMAEQRTEAVTGVSSMATAVAVFTFPEPASREASSAEIERALAPLRTDPRVRALSTPATAAPPIRERMIDARGTTGYALISFAGSFPDAVAAYPAVHASVVSDRAQLTWTGQVPFQHDLDAMLERDLIHAEAIALPIALLVLLLVFRSAVAAVLPVAVGGLAVLGGIACVLALSHVMRIASYTVNVASLIGLGVAIDYSLFTVSRYREELAAGHAPHEAIVRTMQTAGRVVAFSGLAVATGLFGLLVFRGSYLVSMGLGGAIVVALAVLFALTFLPALLVVLGPRIDRGRIPLRRLMPMRGRLLGRLNWVIDHPWRVLIPTALILIVMAVPAFHLRLATVDETVLPPTAEARRGQGMLEATFPDLARNRISVAIEFPSAPALTATRIGALYDLSRRIARIPGVVKVESLVDAPLPLDRAAYQRLLLAPPPQFADVIEAGKAELVRDRTLLLYVQTDLPPDSDGARAIVAAIRTDRTVADGALVVGGQTANDVDATEFILAYSPHAVAFVIIATLIILYVTFRSVVLPVKAVLLNMLSIGAAFGATVWVFQEGNLFVAHGRPLDPTVPILLFCILFGLSMDYHVLVLSRIREAYLQSHDNARAVAAGLARSAGLVTSAAAIMVTVFASFALARFVVIRSVGFGMALAVALDATLVRVLLVPSAMKLLGDWNWWAPRWLPHLRRARRATI